MSAHSSKYESIVEEDVTASEQDQLSIENLALNVNIKPHNVQVHSYKSPHFCDFCGEMLFGIVKQGLKCEGCRQNFHKRCAYKLPNNCIGKKLSTPVPSPSPSMDDFKKLSVDPTKSWGGGRPLWMEKQYAGRMKVPHVFEIHTYHKPTVCNCCKKLLIGLVRQGYKCKDCKYNCHKKCRELIFHTCEGVPLNGNDCNYSLEASSGGSSVASGGMDQSAREEDNDEEDACPHPALDHTESANIPLMRVFQSVKYSRKHGSNVLRQTWLCYFVNKNTEDMKRHFWVLDPLNITLYLSEKSNKFYKVIKLTDILSISPSKTFCCNDYVFALHLTDDRVYHIGGQITKEDNIDSQILVSREQAPHFEQAIRAALLPMHSRMSVMSTEMEVDETQSEDADVSKQYEINTEDILGSGQFGIVYSAQCLATKQTVAIKVIDKQRFPTKQENQLKNEVSILESLDHYGVVKLFKMFETEDKLSIVMEKMDGDMLQMIITSPPARLSERVTKFIMHQILMALKYLHGRCIVHCDLKPENVLLSPTGPHNKNFPQIKLCDFGFARIMGEKSFRKSMVGTPAYLAPEVLKKKSYNRSIDMWSVGVIVYVSLSGTFPFNEDEDISDQIHNATFMYPPHPWSQISQEAKSLVTLLLQVKLQKRCSADKTLLHNWFQDYMCWCDLRQLESQLGRRYLTYECDDTRWETFRAQKDLPSWQEIGFHGALDAPPIYYDINSTN